MVFCSAMVESNQINALLRLGRSHQRVYTDPEIFHLETERTRARFRTSQDPWINFFRGTGMDYDVKNGKRRSWGTNEVLHRARYDMRLSLMTAK